MSAKLSTRSRRFCCIVAFVILSACADGEYTAAQSISDDRSTIQLAVRPTPLQAATTQELESLEVADQSSRAYRFTDSAGDHAVVFSRKVTREVDPLDEAITDRIEVSAVLMDWPSSDGVAATTWQRVDAIECEGVDIEADFYPETFAVTDMYGDGNAELTFAYYRFCGGAIEPADVTVVLQEAGSSYVLEGQTLVKVGSDPAFGGGFTMDAALNDAPKWLREKVLATFRQVRDAPAMDPVQRR